MPMELIDTDSLYIPGFKPVGDTETKITAGALVLTGVALNQAAEESIWRDDGPAVLVMLRVFEAGKALPA